MAAKKAKLIAVSDKGTAAYSFLKEPDTKGKFATNKYKVTIVLDGDTDMSSVEAKAKEAAEAKWGEVPDDLVMPWRDGDESKDEDLHGKITITATSKFQPTLIDSKRNQLPEGVWPFSGDIIKISFGMYAYEKTENVMETVNGKKKKVKVTVYGISPQLRGVQLLEKRAGGGDASNDFEDEDGYEADDTGRDDSDEDGSGDDVDDF